MTINKWPPASPMVGDKIIGIVRRGCAFQALVQAENSEYPPLGARYGSPQLWAAAQEATG
jgi:hypothetical protein